MPPKSDPSHAAEIERMALTRKAMGVSIWLCNAYPSLTPPTCFNCADMDFPSAERTKHVKFALAHILKHDPGIVWGGGNGLEQPEVIVHPAECESAPIMLVQKS